MLTCVCGLQNMIGLRDGVHEDTSAGMWLNGLKGVRHTLTRAVYPSALPVNERSSKGYGALACTLITWMSLRQSNLISGRMAIHNMFIVQYTNTYLVKIPYVGKPYVGQPCTKDSVLVSVMAAAASTSRCPLM